MKTTILYLTILLSLAVSRIDGGWIKAKRDLQGCQNCFHMTFQVFNMPDFVKSMIMSSLNELNMIDTDCVSGTSAVHVCAAPQYQDLSVDRCHSANINITADGLSFLPAARMVVTMVIRSCGRVDLDTENTCGGMDMLDDEDRAHIGGLLHNARQNWNSVNIDGNICIEELQSLY